MAYFIPQKEFLIQTGQGFNSERGEQIRQLYHPPFPEPELEMDCKPGKTFERQFPVKLWRPRRYSGVRRSHSSRRKKLDRNKTRVRVCPRINEVVLLAECESCQHLRDDVCTWKPECETEEAQDEKK